MNVTKYADDSFPLEGDGAASTRRIEADVEDLSVVVGECIVKNWIVVREVHSGAHGDGQHMWNERLVFLNHLCVFGAGESWRNVEWFQPYHYACVIQVLANVRVV